MEETLLEYFEWYLPSDCGHWRRVAENASRLAALGFTGMWLPPAYKGHQGREDVGYGVYDLYDLGEFDQKGSVATKHGTWEKYLSAIRVLQASGLKVCADVVLNHRMGADECEEIRASISAGYDRNQKSPSAQTHHRLD